jgi:hypothetical protein
VLRISASILAGASGLNLLLAASHAILTAIATTGSHVPSKSLFWVHAAFQPDAAEAGLQGSASAYPETITNPGSDELCLNLGDGHPFMLRRYRDRLRCRL